MAQRADVDPRLGVPSCEIPRLHYPTEITPESFERDFAAQSRPCIITGLVGDWPALGTGPRSWRGPRWEQLMGETEIDAGFDPSDGRMMHFGDEEGEPTVLFNPGRLRMPVWAFFEVARLRQLILEERRRRGGAALVASEHPELQRRLQREVTVQNVPFLSLDEASPLQYFRPVQCRVRDLVPLSFYLSHDTLALPEELRRDLQPPALAPAWGRPDSSRVWATNGGPWRLPYPPWSDQVLPEPAEDLRIYSCFHCDRMENLHSVLAGEKELVLVPPGRRDVLKATRHSLQKQWLLAPVAGGRSGGSYLGPTLMTSSSQLECSSDQSAVHPLRPAEVNRRATKGAWPDEVDFPVLTGRLRKGDTLYIPAYHWHWVATSTPPALDAGEEGPLALSVNFWWWPAHNDGAMERWSYENELRSWANRRIALPPDRAPAPEAEHAASFWRLTHTKRAEATGPHEWPADEPGDEPEEFEIVD